MAPTIKKSEHKKFFFTTNNENFHIHVPAYCGYQHSICLCGDFGKCLRGVNKTETTDRCLNCLNNENHEKCGCRTIVSGSYPRTYEVNPTRSRFQVSLTTTMFTSGVLPYALLLMLPQLVHRNKLHNRICECECKC